MSEILANPNFFVEKFRMSDIDGLSPPMLLYSVNSKGFYIPRSNLSSAIPHDSSTEMHFTRITGKMNEVQWNVDSMSEEAGRSMKVLETKLDAHQANMDTLSQITANQSRAINTLALSMADQHATSRLQIQAECLDNSLMVAVLRLQTALPEETMQIREEIATLQVKRMTLSENMERQLEDSAVIHKETMNVIMAASAPPT